MNYGKKLINKRDMSFDALRGVAIVAVVAIHASHYIFMSNNFQENIVTFQLALFYRQVLNFAVPVFIFASGYWVGKKELTSFNEYKHFLKQRLTRVLIPYFFWSLVIFVVTIISRKPIDGSSILYKLFTGGAIHPYYFIILISQFYIITPLMQQMNKRQWGIAISILINLFGLILLYILRLHFGLSLSLEFYALPFYSWIIFFELGLLVTKHDLGKISKNQFFFILIVFITSMVFSFFESNILFTNHNLEFATSAVKVSSFIYSMTFIFIFLYLRQHVQKWPTSITRIGEYSFGIYLIHLPILTMVAYLYQRYNLYLMQSASQFLIILVTLVLCCTLIYASKKLIPASFCKNILGF